MENVPTRVIQGRLGHSQTSTTEIYTQRADGVAERAVEETFGS
jgi:site-specific recombinase XerD